jgi:hypothetical protein
VFEKNIPEEELEKLSKAIAEAIFNSKNVKKIIEKIREKELILPHTLMVMVLKLETLSNISDGDRDNLDIIKEYRKKKKKYKRQLIDGKELDTNEIAFQEFLVKKFDDKEWLKKNGLIF